VIFPFKIFEEVEASFLGHPLGEATFPILF